MPRNILGQSCQTNRTNTAILKHWEKIPDINDVLMYLYILESYPKNVIPDDYYEKVRWMIWHFKLSILLEWFLIRLFESS